MSATEIIIIVLKVSILLTVFVIGLHASFAETIYLFRRPAKLIKSVLSMNGVMLVLAIVLVAAFNLHLPVKLALVALALSPVPPFLPNKVSKAGGTEPYMIGLLVAASLLSVIIIPVSLELLERIFQVPLGIPPLLVAKVVLISVLVPLFAGIAIRALAPVRVAKLLRPLSLIATIMLLAAVVPLIVASWSTIWSLVGNGTILVLVFFNLAGLAIGHLLGGPRPEDRTVLALCTAFRHPGIALALANANFSSQKLSAPAILLYLITSTIAGIPYLQYTKRQHTSTAANKN